MKSTAEVIRHLLVTDGRMTSETSFVSSMPENALPVCICVFDTSPVKNGRIMSSGEVIKKHGIMIHVRSTAHVSGWLKINELCTALDGIKRRSLQIEEDTYRVAAASLVSGPHPIGQENGPNGSRRFMFSVNYKITMGALGMSAVSGDGWQELALKTWAELEAL